MTRSAQLKIIVGHKCPKSSDELERLQTTVHT